MLIANATQQVIEARRRHRVEMVEKTRLRRLVERIDSAIEACEETHLQGVKEVPVDLRARVEQVFVFARKAIRLSGSGSAIRAVEETLARRKAKVTEVMDILWTVQEIAFDLMLPWRVELPEDVEDAEDAPVWRPFHPTA